MAIDQPMKSAAIATTTYNARMTSITTSEIGRCWVGCGTFASFGYAASVPRV
jgi:hypothetical protein